MRTLQISLRNVAIRAGLVACVAAVALTSLAAPASADTAASARSASVMPFQAYTDWSWPAKTYTSTTQALKITKVDPGSRYFWAYDFAVGGGGVGYMGLQAGSHPNTTKIAIFSIWGADRAEGAACGTFDGEGVGWTCRLDPFAWVVGRTYVLTVAVDGGDSTGTWYKATVRDLSTKKVSTIGRIHHPTARGKVAGRGSWTEWFGGRAATCADLKRSTVEWGIPTSGAKNVKASSHRNHVASKDGSASCATSASVVDGPNFVRQSVGPK